MNNLIGSRAHRNLCTPPSVQSITDAEELTVDERFNSPSP
jgi:hypothetical protein